MCLKSRNTSSGHLNHTRDITEPDPVDMRSLQILQFGIISFGIKEHAAEKLPMV